MRLLSLLTIVFALGPLDGLPPILPPSGGGGGGGSGAGGTQPGPPNDADGFPDVGAPRFHDPGSRSPAAVWGSVDCASEERVGRSRRGDPKPPPGRVRKTAGARRVQVRDGDDFFGERCELGRNDHRTSPVAVYREGERLITFASIRLGKKFPIGRERWQTVLQMKEAQPYDGGGRSPVLTLHAYENRWRLWTSGAGATGERLLWTARARTGRWARFAFDVTYSQDPGRGALRVAVDLNGDGDALDRSERSERFSLRTLQVEGAGDDSDGLSEGDSIPSHLRAGIYHDPAYRCERSKCAIGFDNVGVYEPD